jgi:two-component system, OmpR family, phosphate regulon response regulator PhoB
MALGGDPGRVSPNAPRVLIAAADKSFTSFVEYVFRSAGLDIATAKGDDDLVDQILDQPPDALLLESSMPGVDARALCARLRLHRRTRTIAIVVFASEGGAEHQTDLLESGADQYLAKPFTPEQLVASVQSALREARRSPELEMRDLLTFLDLEMDLAGYRVRRSGRDIHLAPTEFRLLQHFMKHPGRVYSRDELQHAAWPRSANLSPRTVDVHIGRLRAALTERGERNVIRTVRSVGYALSD